jgi:hypothetical protein
MPLAQALHWGKELWRVKFAEDPGWMRFVATGILGNSSRGWRDDKGICWKAAGESDKVGRDRASKREASKPEEVESMERGSWWCCWWRSPISMSDLI